MEFKKENQLLNSSEKIDIKLKRARRYFNTAIIYSI